MRNELIGKLNEIEKAVDNIKEMLQLQRTQTAGDRDDIFLHLRDNSRNFIMDAYKYFGLLPFSIKDRVLNDLKFKHRIHNVTQLFQTMEKRGVIRTQRKSDREVEFTYTRSL